MAQIRSAIEKRVKTLREIDLINLTDESVQTELLKNILKEGILWKEAKNSKELLESLKRRLVS